MSSSSESARSVDIEVVKQDITEAIQQIINKHHFLDADGMLTSWVLVGCTEHIDEDSWRVFKLAQTTGGSVMEMGLLAYGKNMLVEQRFNFSGHEDE